MIQTLFIKTDNQKAIEAFKALALELGLQLTPYEDDEDEDDEADIADVRAYRNDERVSWEEAKRILSNKEERDAL